MKNKVSNEKNSGLLGSCVTSMILSAALLSFSNSSQAAILTGEKTYLYHASNGTTSPVFVNLGSGPVSTGNLSYLLDLANPSNSTFSFNFDTKTIQVEVDYFLDFPLLQKIGEPPIKYHLSETGTIVSDIPDLPVGKSQKLIFKAVETGVGIADPNSILGGLKYKTFNELIVNLLVDVEEGGIFNPHRGADGSIDLVDIQTELIFPGGISQKTVGTGNSKISVTPVPVPEPFLLTPLSTTTLLGALFLLQQQKKLRKQRKFLF